MTDKAQDITAAISGGISRDMAEGVEKELAAALDTTEPGWTLDSLHGRLGRSSHPDGSETYWLDGQAVLFFGPVKTRIVASECGYKMEASRDVKKMYENTTEVDYGK